MCVISSIFHGAKTFILMYFWCVMTLKSTAFKWVISWTIRLWHSSTDGRNCIIKKQVGEDLFSKPKAGLHWCAIYNLISSLVYRSFTDSLTFHVGKASLLDCFWTQLNLRKEHLFIHAFIRSFIHPCRSRGDMISNLSILYCFGIFSPWSV